MVTVNKKLVTDNWKSIGVFLVLLVYNAAVDLSKSGQPWPATGGDWARFGVSQIGGTLAVYVFPANTNKPKPRRRRRKRTVPPPSGPTQDPQQRPVV